MTAKLNKTFLPGDTYLGLLADTKPTVGVADGSAFVEFDTGTIYGFFDGTWYDASDIYGGGGGSNVAVELLANAARVASVDSVDFINNSAAGGHIVIDVTAVTGTPSIQVAVQGKDIVSGNYYNILESEAIIATGKTVLKIYPAFHGGVPNNVVSDIIPNIYRISVTHADSDSITYSVSANLVG